MQSLLHDIVFMRPTYLRVAIAALLTLLFMSPSLAEAHVLPQERKIDVQISADRVEILVEFLEPPNERVELLLQRFDLNGDGELSAPEAKLAGSVWAKHALSGLQFEVVGESPAGHEPEIKFRREKKGALTSLLYMRWDLPKLEPGATRTFRVKTLSDPQTVPTALSISPGERTDIREIAVPIRFKSNVEATVLKPGEQAHLRVQLGDAVEDTTGPAQ